MHAEDLGESWARLVGVAIGPQLHEAEMFKYLNVLHSLIILQVHAWLKKPARKDTGSSWLIMNNAFPLICTIYLEYMQYSCGTFMCREALMS